MMADAETEAEWAKSKRIEAERMKAARAIEQEKPSRTNLSYLDPNLAKTKGFGYSRGREAILSSIERLGNASAVAAFGGIVIDLAMWLLRGLMFNAAGAMMLGIVQGAGILLMAVAAFAAVFSLLAAGWFYLKYKYKPRAFLWTALTTLIILAIYAVIKNWIMI